VRLRRLGVAGLITDFPGALRRAIAAS
jgi:glycerophosphoryl diester phosphodiesterase